VNGYVQSFLLFVVGIVFSLLIFTVLLRLVLQIVRADFYNPISQFLMRVTNPMLLPLRRIIPGLFGIDMAAVVLLVIIEALQIVVTHLLQGMGLHTPLLFLGELLGMIIQHTAQLFFFSILVMVIISWVNPSANYHPIGQLVHQITEPLLRPARKILPPFNGIDLSPILAIIFLAAIMFLIAAPLIDLPHKIF
jgi:YggT family protein